MRYTAQLISESGSFGHPSGTDIEYAKGLDGLKELFDYWQRQHDIVGSDRADACMLVWIGYIDDTTDVYPDFEVSAGIRGGFRRVSL
jgi:hypothetical protein